MSFQFRPAKSFTDRHGLFVGLTGGTNSGKTFSALRLARGIAGPKGKIAVIDTEGGRTLHLKDQFDFDAHVMDAPFRPHFFSEGAKAAEDAGYDCCLIDSFSMEWTGMGGVLDWQEQELNAMWERAKSRPDNKRSEYQVREAGKMAAWIKPKMEHKAMVYSFLQRRMPIIFAIRGEETIKPGEPGRPPTKLFKSICSATFPFEITVSFRLATEARGIIDLSDQKSFKMERVHEGIFHHGEQISEAHGAALAAWARGEGRAPLPTEPTPEDRYPTLFGIDDGRQWLANLGTALALATDEQEVVDIGGLSSVGETLKSAPEPVRSEVNAMLAEAMARVMATEEAA